MAYQLTNDQGNALHYLALALRPEWAPRTKNSPGPGTIWQQEIKHNTFPHAQNFDHCIAALIDYCNAEKQGTKRYTHPRLFPTAEDIWKSTVPTNLEKKPRNPCTDHPMDKNNANACIGCRSEILAGMRPWNMQGKPLTPEKRQPVPSPGLNR